MARYVALAAPGECEFALAVADGWQGRGVGYRLMQTLVRFAREAGYTRMEGYVLAANHKMLELMQALGFAIGPSDEGPQVRLATRLPSSRIRRMTKSRRVRQSEVAPYSPANHTGTRNYRLIGPETVGAKQVEVLVGEIERGKGALPHAHPGIEQVCYLLEGAAHVEVEGEKFELAPGEACFFPAGAQHLFVVTSERAKVLVIYAPPYLEKQAGT